MDTDKRRGERARGKGEGKEKNVALISFTLYPFPLSLPDLSACIRVHLRFP
jgi:hypothetical protein